MDELVEAIRAAVAPEAPNDIRTAGAAACRTILTALDSSQGPAMTEAAVAPSQTSKIANAVAMLRNVPADQLLDLAIAKLRAALPAGTEVAPAQPLKFQLIPVAPLAALRRTP
jgi:hypothetical protein